MLTGRTIRTSIVILAATVAAATQAQAHSTSCTPAHLVSALKQVEARAAPRKSSRRTGRAPGSPPVACRSTRSATAPTARSTRCSRTAPARSAPCARPTTGSTYGKSAHIHIGTLLAERGRHQRCPAQHHCARAYRRSNVRALAMRRGSAAASAPPTFNGPLSRTAGATATGRTKQRGLSLSAALPRPLVSRQRSGVRVAQRQGHGQNWGDAQWSGSNWSSNH